MSAIVGAMVMLVTACAAPAAAPTTDPGTNPPLRTSALPPPTPRPVIVARPAAELVLSLADVPAGFTLHADTARTIEDVAAAFADSAAGRARLQELGFQSAHGREFRRASFFGLLGILSNATVYASAAGSQSGLRLNREQTMQRAGVQEVSLGEVLGDESVGLTVTAKDTTGAYTLTTIYVYWRYGNVSNSIIAVGTEGTVDAAAAVDLARKQLTKQRTS